MNSGSNCDDGICHKDVTGRLACSGESARVVGFLTVLFLILPGVCPMAAAEPNSREVGESLAHARQDPGRREATQILIDLRRTDPTRAQWCLERLVPLYEQQVKEHPAVLEHRLSLADTLNELALLRIDTLDASLRRGKLDPVEAVRQTQQAATEASSGPTGLGESCCDRTK